MQFVLHFHGCIHNTSVRINAAHLDGNKNSSTEAPTFITLTVQHCCSCHCTMLSCRSAGEGSQIVRLKHHRPQVDVEEWAEYYVPQTDCVDKMSTGLCFAQGNCWRKMCLLSISHSWYIGEGTSCWRARPKAIMWESVMLESTPSSCSTWALIPNL